MDFRHDTDLRREELPKKGRGVPDAIGCKTFRLLFPLNLEEEQSNSSACRALERLQKLPGSFSFAAF